MKKYINRPKYLQKIKRFLGPDIIKIIIGQRRTGKSYLLKQIYDWIHKKYPNRQIIYIDKELYEFRDIIDDDTLVRYVESKVNSQNPCIIIDEIQEIRNFQKAVRDFFAKGYEIFISGSNSSLLSGELATFLSGRYVKIEVYPLSYSEFLNFHKLPDNDESLQKFLKYGGMPYLHNVKLENETVRDYLSNLYDTIILKDVVSRYRIKNIDFLHRLVLFIADNIGNPVSAHRISNFLKSQTITISHNIILNYLKYLSDAFLINPVKRFDIQGKRFLEILDKYYFTDIGIRNFLIGYRAVDIGKIIENAVFIHLKINGYQVSI
jgi:predicted AAA+ superfamily ATPase